MLGIPLDNKRSKLEFAFPLFILILSLFNIQSELVSTSINVQSFGLSIFGVLGVILYFLKINFSKYLFKAWALLQVLIITKFTESGNTDIINFTQGFNLSFSLLLGSIQFQINFLGFIYASFIYLIGFNLLKNKSIIISPYNDSSYLNSILPIEATILKRIEISDEKDWMLVQLNHLESEGEEKLKYALIKGKDQVIKPKSGQIIKFLEVSNIEDLKDKNNDKENFRTGDWAILS